MIVRSTALATRIALLLSFNALHPEFHPPLRVQYSHRIQKLLRATEKNLRNISKKMLQRRLKDVKGQEGERGGGNI